ncbi:L-ribulose-5-phosphate 4-epimerase [Actinomyces lilanjuaniae]|uniref:L-ribulose-5-phosphate 4-epimerase n=1 Tax=Actinomyces lilanjuaniae TaxID=2321394 RepID=A0ABN5PM23_9ACTO|nr:L-ribulose-5-phosphate 4-epimerase [Actinomyces lilanjuaniae]AYD89281.1 L-ribulose-5-phosphate 4-epimerase [Actinomyces lilanjuaniae]
MSSQSSPSPSPSSPPSSPSRSSQPQRPVPVLSELDPALREAVAATREVVAALHAELPRWGLVVWTAGNVSQRVVVDRGSGPEKTDLFVIKPSGVSYDELSADTMVVCTLEGDKIEDGTPARLTPSSDTAAHAYVYRHMDHVGGVVHTHSTYATAWAARREPIPCVLTMMADEFGGDVPVGPFALIGDDSIGRGIVETLSGSRSPAVLMANHGPFTIGRDARAAVKAAVMCEEVARTVHVARQGGEVVSIAADQVERLNNRYQNVYGQR